MFRKYNKQGRVPMRSLFLILALTVAILLIGMAGTFAWMHYARTLQTAARIQVFDLSIVGPTENTLAMNLGEINSKSDTSPRYYVFGVKSNVLKYWIQLGYTTNNPFSFQIFKATKSDSVSTEPGFVTEAGVSFKKGELLTNPVFFGKNHPATYKKTGGTYDYVQDRAEPFYQQYGPITTIREATQYYILEVQWNAPLVDKETDMVYLTVGTNGIDSN